MTGTAASISETSHRDDQRPGDVTAAAATAEGQHGGTINQQIFDSSLDLILVVDRGGTFVRVSPSVKGSLGFEPQELVGRSAQAFIYPPDLENTREQMRLARRRKMTRYFRCRYVHKRGQVVTLSWMGVWSEPEQQHIFIGRDISELREVRRSLREVRAAHDAAVNANRAKSRFLATASHDLRQPLHAMNLFISALRRRVSDPDALQLVAGLAAATESMQGMFNALLDVSKLEAGVVAPDVRDFALEDVLARLRASFDGPAAAKGLELEIPRSEARLHSDPALLESVLRNLVSNALRYTRKGCVTMRYETQGSKLRIAVSDTGVGIPAGEFERVFEEFHRLDNMPGGERGLGLGLAIVRRLATLLNIDVSVTSEVGVGSVFSVAVAAAVAPAVPDAVAQATDHMLTGRRLLLVEDDALARDALAQEVADWGAVPLVFGSAEEALARLTTAGAALPELAIVDRDLGGPMTGPALLAALRQRLNLAIPAIVITGATDPDALAALRQSGHPWITKPVDAALLRRTAGQLLAPQA